MDENSSFIFTRYVKTVPVYNFKAAFTKNQIRLEPVRIKFIRISLWYLVPNGFIYGGGPTWNRTIPVPGGELGILRDRDQWSWVFLNNPKKYFATDRKPKKILFGKQNPKKYT